MIAFRNTPFNDEQKKELTALCTSGGYQVKWYEKNEEVQIKDIQNAKALMGYFPAECLKELASLKWLQVPSAGVDRLCGNIYASESVVLTNSSGAFGAAISEYMLCGLMMLMKSFPAYMKNQRAHAWERNFPCRSMTQSTIAVVGMGDIGREFARRAKAMGAYIRGVKRTPAEPDELFDEVYTASDLKKAVKGVDAVVMSLPGTHETRKILSCEIIGSLDQKTIIVNAGRGATIDQEALTEALVSGKIAGAVLDVFEKEPLDENSPLWDLENVIVTPHISGSDFDDVNAVRIFNIFKENLTRFIENKPLMNVVDRSLGY